MVLVELYVLHSKPIVYHENYKSFVCYGKTRAKVIPMRLLQDLQMSEKIENPGNGKWLRNIAAWCFSDLRGCLGVCSLGVVHITSQTVSLFAKGAVTLAGYRHEYGHTKELFLVESNSQEISLETPKKLNMDFVKASFADAVHKKVPNMKANDAIIIATGAAAQYVGGATIQNLVSEAYTKNFGENALASKITQTAEQQAYLVSGHAASTSTCIVAFLAEKLQ